MTPKAGRALLEDLQELHARDAAEAVAAGGNALALEMNVDVVPMAEGLRDVAVRFGIGFPEAAHGFVGEDDAPAEGAVGTVAFNDGEVPGRIRFFGEDREVKSGGSATEAGDFHDGRPRRASASFSPVSSARAASRSFLRDWAASFRRELRESGHQSVKTFAAASVRVTVAFYDAGALGEFEGECVVLLRGDGELSQPLLDTDVLFLEAE